MYLKILYICLNHGIEVIFCVSESEYSKLLQSFHLLVNKKNATQPCLNISNMVNVYKWVDALSKSIIPQ